MYADIYYYFGAPTSTTHVAASTLIPTGGLIDLFEDKGDSIRYIGYDSAARKGPIIKLD